MNKKKEMFVRTCSLELRFFFFIRVGGFGVWVLPPSLSLEGLALPLKVIS